MPTRTLRRSRPVPPRRRGSQRWQSTPTGVTPAPGHRVPEAAKYADQRADFYKTVAEHPVLPEKLKIAPAGWFGLGVGAGVVAVLGGAIAVRWASEVPVTTTAE